jgi:hypothetical protein
MNMESLETELADSFPNLEIVNSIEMLPQVITNTISKSLPNPEVANILDTLPDPEEISNSIAEFLPNPEEFVKTLDLPNPEVANILDTLPDPEEMVNTLLAESLPNPEEMVNTLLAESLPNPEEMVNTLLAETLSNPEEMVNTLLAESLPNPEEMVNTLLAESLPNPEEMVNTLLAESLPNPEEMVNALLAESLPNPEEMVNTLLAETLLNSPKVENVDSLINCIEVITTLESLINSPKVENVESLPTVIPSFSQIPGFKRPQLRIQLPTFNKKITVPTELVLSPLREIEKEQTKEKEQKDKNQDTAQKMAVLSTLVLELYRMLTSSLLILFVPQSCKGQLCSISDNLTWNPKNHKYNFGLCVNFITLFTYTCLYYVELKRENRLIKYLDVNPDMPSSNEAVENTLQNIAEEKKRKILAIDKYYQRISYLSIGMYVFNSVVSGVVISKYYFGTQTTTSFITAILFMFSKLLNVYQVSNTEEHIFYSGYMKTFVQFNDLDKSHKNPDNL